jgi:hypothetical protein
MYFYVTSTFSLRDTTSKFVFYKMFKISVHIVDRKRNWKVTKYSSMRCSSIRVFRKVSGSASSTAARIFDKCFETGLTTSVLADDLSSFWTQGKRNKFL